MRSAERVTAGFRESLARLQLNYVDLIQCHDIEFTQLDQVGGQAGSSPLELVGCCHPACSLPAAAAVVV